MAASAIDSIINPKTLETCVKHIRGLLEDIETLQQTLTVQVDGNDHSKHHQSLMGPYFWACGHLDSVLFGKTATSIVDGMAFVVQAGSTHLEFGIEKNMIDITLHNASPSQGILTEADLTKAIQYAKEKTRMEKREKMRRVAEELHAEREAVQREVEKKILEEHRMLLKEQRIEALRHPTTKLQDTLGRNYFILFRGWRTCNDMHERINRAYAHDD